MGKQLNVENSVISAKDDAYFFNAFIGKNGVWPYGNKLAHEIINSNTINIKDGIVTAQGRNYIIYPDEIDVITIQNGTVNTKRNDLIVYEFSRKDGVESCGIKVVKGTNSTTPSDPVLIQDDTLKSGQVYQLPLYRVRLNGINLEGVDDLRIFVEPFGSVSNQNLLLNGDFGINSRGQSSYTGVVDGVARSIYTLDMWRSYGVNVALAGNTITIANRDTVYHTFRQLMTKLEDGIYTVSMNVKSITGSALFNPKHDKTKGKKVHQGLNTYTFEMKSGDDTKHTDPTFILGLEPNCVLELDKWIKLEKGHVATKHFIEDKPTALNRVQKKIKRYIVLSNNFSIYNVDNIYFSVPIDSMESETADYAVVISNFSVHNAGMSDLNFESCFVYQQKRNCIVFGCKKVGHGLVKGDIASMNIDFYVTEEPTEG